MLAPKHHKSMQRTSDGSLTFISRRGLTQGAKLVVGLPMLSSPGNLRFWAALCGCSVQDADLAALLADFEHAAAAGKLQLQRFCYEWNADLLCKVPLHMLHAVAALQKDCRAFCCPSCGRKMHATSCCNGALQSCLQYVCTLPDSSNFIASTGAGVAWCERGACNATDCCGPQHCSGAAGVTWKNVIHTGGSTSQGWPAAVTQWCAPNPQHAAVRVC